MRRSAGYRSRPTRSRHRSKTRRYEHERLQTSFRTNTHLEPFIEIGTPLVKTANGTFLVQVNEDIESRRRSMRLEVGWSF